MKELKNIAMDFKPEININNNIVSDIVNDYKDDSDKKKFIGIHFEADIAEKLQEISKQGKKGMQSKIVNDAVRKLFQERGLFD